MPEQAVLRALGSVPATYVSCGPVLLLDVPAPLLTAAWDPTSLSLVGLSRGPAYVHNASYVRVTGRTRYLDLLPLGFYLRSSSSAGTAWLLRPGRAGPPPPSSVRPSVRAPRGPSVCSPPAQHARPVLSSRRQGHGPPAAATPSVMELCSYSYLWFMCWRSICRDVYYWGGSGGLRSSSIFARDAAEAEAADPLVEDGWWWWWLCNGADSSPNCATWD